MQSSTHWQPSPHARVTEWAWTANCLVQSPSYQRPWRIYWQSDYVWHPYQKARSLDPILYVKKAFHFGTGPVNWSKEPVLLRTLVRLLHDTFLSHWLKAVAMVMMFPTGGKYLIELCFIDVAKFFLTCSLWLAPIGTRTVHIANENRRLFIKYFLYFYIN